MRLALVPSAGRGAARRRVSDEPRRRRRAGRGDQTRRRRALRLALLLDDEALAEEDVDDVARAVTDAICVRLTSLRVSRKPTLLRLVLFRSTRRRSRKAAASRALRTPKKHQNTHPPLVAVVGPGVKRATLRALARTVGGAVVLDARAVEPGDLARSVRVSCAAAGWDTDDSAEPTRRASRRASDAPRRFATVSLEDGEEEKLLRRKTRLTASLVLFDRTETAANARAAEFRRTMRRVSHALACPFSREAEASRGGAARASDWSLLFPVFLEDDDDDDDATRRGRVLPGGGCFELAAAAALARAAHVARSRVADATRALDAEETRVRVALAALAAEEAPLAPAAAEASRYAGHGGRAASREPGEGDGPRACARCVRGAPPRRPQGRGAERRRALDDAAARGARAEAALDEARVARRRRRRRRRKKNVRKKKTSSPRRWRA